jgi:hypothetical protein
MDFVAVDRLESALGEIRLRGRREQVELADAARCETVEKLPDDAASDASEPPQPTIASPSRATMNVLQ